MKTATAKPAVGTQIRISEARRRIGIGRTKMDELVMLGMFSVKRRNGFRFLFADEVERYLTLTGNNEELKDSMESFRARKGRMTWN